MVKKRIESIQVSGCAVFSYFYDDRNFSNKNTLLFCQKTGLTR